MKQCCILSNPYLSLLTIAISSAADTAARYVQCNKETVTMRAACDSRHFKYIVGIVV
jgi:hypothetical protein